MSLASSLTASHSPKAMYENSSGYTNTKTSSTTTDDVFDPNTSDRPTTARRPLSYIAMKSLLEERNDLKWQLEKTLSKLVLNHTHLPDVDGK